MTNITNEAGIYIIRNTVNTNVYIGQSAYLLNRVKWHLRQLKKNKHANPKIQRFVNKYGIDSISFDVLELCERDKGVLCDREQHYMNQYPIKFNISKSAYSTLGVKKSADERRRMSERRKGVKQTPEQIEAAAAPKRGKKKPPFTEQHKRNLSKAMKGRPAHFKGKTHKPETKELFRQIALSRPPVSDEFREKMKQVTGGEKNGMYGRKHSEETKDKIRQKRIEYNQRRKAA